MGNAYITNLNCIRKRGVPVLPPIDEDEEEWEEDEEDYDDDLEDYEDEDEEEF